MNKALKILGLVIGLVSTGFSLLTFTVQLTGRTMCWSEPNKIIGSAEVFLAYVGVVLLFILLYREVKKE